ncbi:MAG TPA: hypothetical protein EYN66_07305 [Myxococcales bacterium]|nr:hypothetical protein [Myxococcales bacterium]
MVLSKPVLVVGKADGELSSYTEYLEQHSYTVGAVVALSQVQGVLERNAMSAILFSANLNESEFRVVSNNVLVQHRGLPMCIVSDVESPLLGDTSVVHSTTEPAKFVERVESLLKLQFYPDAVIDTFIQVVCDVLRRSYRTNCHCSDMQLSASSTVLSDVNATVPFSGSGLWGRVLISGSFQNFDRVLDDLFGNETRGVGAHKDLAGEICNQVVGNFKALLEKLERSAGMGIPGFLEKQSNAPSWKGSNNSLRCAMHSAKGELIAELSLICMNPAWLNEMKALDSETNEELVFF